MKSCNTDISVACLSLQVALLNSGRQFCGASLLDSTHILTAAHCVAQ